MCVCVIFVIHVSTWFHKNLFFCRPGFLPLQTRDLQSEVVSTVGLLAADFWMPWRGWGEMLWFKQDLLPELSSWKHFLGQHLDSTWNCGLCAKGIPQNLGFFTAGMQFTNISKLAKIGKPSTQKCQADEGINFRGTGATMKGIPLRVLQGTLNSYLSLCPYIYT